MKKILFVRHAKSSWSNRRLPDFQRPLNSRGEADLPLMAGVLKEKFPQVDFILCSSALRARQTAEGLCKGLDIPPEKIEIFDELYLPARENFRDALTEAQGDNIMVVSHNPGTTEIVNWLCGEKLEDFPTCAFACVEFSGDSLDQLDEGTCKLLWFEWPKKHQ